MPAYRILKVTTIVEETETIVDALSPDIALAEAERLDENGVLLFGRETIEDCHLIVEAIK